VDLDISNKEHINPNPSLTRLIEHIQTVDSYENSAKLTVDELEEDDDDGTIRETIDTSDIFGSTVVTEQEDIEGPIEELWAEVEDLLDQDGEVEIRFR